MTAIERRIAALEAVLAPPKPSAYDEALAANQWIRWLTTDELVALDNLFHETKTETIGDMSEADQARAAVVFYAAEARRLAGELPEDEKGSWR